MRNYLLRLGWSHGDDEIISTEQAIQWFDLPQVGRSASRFDFAKLDNLNGHYIREADDARLAADVAVRLGVTDAAVIDRLRRGMPGLKARAKTLKELAENARIYVTARPLPMADKAAALLVPDAKSLLGALAKFLDAQNDWTTAALEAAVRQFSEQEKVKLGQIAQPLRAALTGSTTSPGIFEVMEILGQSECLGRIGDCT